MVIQCLPVFGGCEQSLFSDTWNLVRQGRLGCLAHGTFFTPPYCSVSYNGGYVRHYDRAPYRFVSSCIWIIYYISRGCCRNIVHECKMRRKTKVKKLSLFASAILCCVCLTSCGNQQRSSEPTRIETTASAIQAQEVTTENIIPEAMTAEEPEKKSEFSIGETWTVDGQWNLTVTGVTATEDRNEFSDKNPAAVYIVDYTYTNIGYEDESGIMDGLFFSMEDTIVDSSNVMGYSYPGDISNYPTETPIGATCNAQACIGVDNPGSFKISVSKYDGTGTEQSATFCIEVN